MGKTEKQPAKVSSLARLSVELPAALSRKLYFCPLVAPASFLSTVAELLQVLQNGTLVSQAPPCDDILAREGGYERSECHAT